MAETIILPEDYRWSASFGLFEMVVSLLVDRVQDQQARDQLQAALDFNLGAVNVRDMPAAARDEVLRVIRGDLVDAFVSDPRLTTDEESRRLAIGHVKVLRLMANDIARVESC